MKKLISSIILALIPFALGVFILVFPERTITIVFFMIAVFILLSSLKELYIVLSFDELSQRIRNVGIAKNAINLIFSIVLIFLSFSNPTALIDIVVYLVAIDLLLTAVSDSLDYFYLRRLGFGDVPFLDVGLRIALSVIMFFFPSFISSTFIKIVAVVLIVISILYLVISILKYKKKGDEIYVEYEEKN